MRNQLAKDQVGLLRYGLREIVDVAHRLRDLDDSLELVYSRMAQALHDYLGSA